MKKSGFLLILPTIAMVILFFCSCSEGMEIKAENGRMDLSAWDFSKNGIVQLDGAWEFYWNKLLTHEDFLATTPHITPQYQNVPALWNTYKIDGEKLPVTGYATFRLIVTLPDTERLYAFKLNDMSTAYNLHVDGKYIMGAGRVGTNKDESIPKWMSQTGICTPESASIEILIQVSNFHYSQPGFWKSISFGPQDMITQSFIQAESWDFFIMGIYLAIAIYHLTLFFLGRKDKATLFFGIFCLLFTIRSIFTDERIAFHLYPSIPWHTGLLMEFVSIYYLAIIFIMFLKALYPKELSTLLNRIIFIFSFIFSLVVLFLPSIMIHSAHSFYSLFLILLIIYMTIALILATIRNRVGALYLLIGFFFFAITIFYDILASEFIINTNFISPIGILFFIFAEFALYRKFIKAEEELREREKELLQAEKLASLGTLIAGVAHEINNPNSSIFLTISSILSIWKNLEPELEEYLEKEGDFYVGSVPYSEVKGEIPGALERIMRNSQRITEIVKDLKDYAKKDESNTDQPVDINAVIQSAHRLLENLIKKCTHKFELILASSLPPVRGSTQRLEQVILNIIQNGCQALDDPEKGITITTAYDESIKKVIITVQDQGIGMDKKTLKQIYDPFFTTKRTKGGTGLGMSVTSRIIQDHGGILTIKSKPGKGTTVKIILGIIDTPAHSR
ncbi:MAG: GHKL domain-containing protein [Spirochaetales bacterium]|nr:GHKL domain-containing protein [Spirochaetales bacterium]